MSDLTNAMDLDLSIGFWLRSKLRSIPNYLQIARAQYELTMEGSEWHIFEFLN